MYKIMGKYGREPWEEVDEFDTKAEADAMLAEYRMAFGPEWTLKVKKGAA